MTPRCEPDTHDSVAAAAWYAGQRAALVGLVAGMMLRARHAGRPLAARQLGLLRAEMEAASVGDIRRALARWHRTVDRAIRSVGCVS